MPGKFEIFEDKSGGHRFNLLASNGQVIAASESYKARSAAGAGIELVRKNAPDAPVLDRHQRGYAGVAARLVPAGPQIRYPS